MQPALALVPVLILVPTLGFLLPVLVRLWRTPQPNESLMDWFEHFNPSIYIPMQGLLAREDFEFLSSQPGFDASLSKKFRADRLRIFREYLNRLIVDFNRLYVLASTVIAHGRDDQSELFGKLVVLRYRFWISILRVEFNYLLCRLGAPSISLGGLLQQMDAISQIAIPPQARAASL